MGNERSKAGLVFYALAFGGAALFTFLLIRYNLGDVASAVATAKWGVAAVIALHFAPLFADTLSWWNLFPKENRLRLRPAFWMRWVGESVSFLMPMSAVGGDILRARLAMLRGTPVGIAAASVLADLTLGVMVQAAFTLIGIGLLINATGQTNLLAPILGGVVIAAFCLGGFVAVQRFGLFRILGFLVKRLAKDPAWHALAEKVGGIDEALRLIYGNRRAMARCCVSTMAAWLLSSAEVWIALRAMGLDARFDHAIILESMSQGMRAVMFFVPGALGVQEGGYVAVGKMLGIHPDTALALSLIRRARELAFGIPGLISWQFSEGHRIWSKRNGANP